MQFLLVVEKNVQFFRVSSYRCLVQLNRETGIVFLLPPIINFYVNIHHNTYNYKYSKFLNPILFVVS